MPVVLFAHPDDNLRLAMEKELKKHFKVITAANGFEVLTTVKEGL